MKALIVWGGWNGHTPKETGEVFAEILREEGFEVTISDTLDYLADLDNLRTFDLFVPIWTMGEIDGKYCENVCTAVAEGMGIAGCHGGMCDSFRNSTQWQFLTGSQWIAHPGNDGTDYRVNIVKTSSSPIVDGLDDFDVSSEQYYIHVDPAVNVLATTTFPTADGPHAANGSVVVPVVYTKLWGEGRVFYNSLGHTYKIFDIPEAKELMRRGFLWATR
ncbi:MAG TPA: ThuA domain-containing protein [Oscillospiraceae bacterium]|nr:ThuA domain-containing protein [Oscillospiraceae bacterium]HPF56619.1 ThuA domain-containing protein [Clostridiales bacterium]HPK36510.1 ThuA domain-containing protein [Oscillospiraceae bacterium]HPR75743.1 ThuA domain-containing protein [Oscillospiraceae bacterium]